MTIQDAVIICVMGVPMLLFSVFPGLKLADFLEEKYNMQEKQKRIVAITTTVLFTITLSSLLHYI
ncbi:MAG: hypothetical protein A2513_11275 [Sulfurimonas sp. RIFOXYD12_FULL_33_39]|uniref:hypothetical protein n=1 Tax=unclassified Sulfurimonas TaxID=2623549 RepID=UPI0008D84BBD|nr:MULTISPECIES: hypothetical protein [unclassified Sulfurimonas]OHE02253.1 MAG: hypothetical protein A3G74_01090 [Sulfurimonas sp. RIFCSPLOWO2_12_FULL_34_6]OHE09877.1 MAG: hypothetical protein A2513_11275 [Sulfurimonas sp. RIFOXYD12_FULL_33_39]OHE13615.1 MAG: hypothetical protein A2530_08480 [Sulfurimonas sp. RIFOXYD2_FULL_34_21]